MNENFGPYFSIIIPVYNVSRFLRTCLESVLNQSFPNWECLCVDDGSTDESGNLLDQYAKKDVRFRVFHKVNGGVGSARNLGIENARGKWLLFLDGDDAFCSNLLKNLVRTEAECQAQFEVIRFGFDGFVTDEDFKECEQRAIQEEFKLGECADISKALGPKHIGGCMWRYAYLRAKFQPLRFMDCKIGEDMVYLNQAMVAATSCAEVLALGYCYRCWGGGASSQKIALRQFVDQRRYAISIIRVLADSGKKIDPSIYRFYASKLTETLATIGQLPDADKGKAWSAWYEYLEKAKQYRYVFSPWLRFVMTVCLTVRLHAVAWLLAALPYQLKQMGLNRGLLKRLLKRK